METKIKIVIAGASGYIGKALIPELLKKFPNAAITALSRREQYSNDKRVQWRACDLFSLKSLEEALPTESDLAFYLVHSMGPTAKMDQGSFADYDLILADNFARAVKKTNAQQVIYLGGLVPTTEELSLHLQSRIEVEDIFAEHKLPLTTFRAGLILGENGSSFQILLKLVSRLPIMICPRWTQTLTTPVDLQSVLSALTEVSGAPEHIHRVYDLAGCQPISYLQMMKETAQRLGKKRFFVTMPFIKPALSRLWISLITNTPKNLVYPLLDSLEHTMVARKENLYSEKLATRQYADIINNMPLQILPGPTLFKPAEDRNTVRSVQRLPLPLDKNAIWVKEKYINWLPQFLAPLISVHISDDFIRFTFYRSRIILLELKLSQERSNADRQLLYITNGWLVKNEGRGRLEFRVVLNRRYVIAAIHDYRPALPWFIYKYSQALLHIVVMKAFRRHLNRYLMGILR